MYFIYPATFLTKRNVFDFENKIIFMIVTFANDFIGVIVVLYISWESN